MAITAACVLSETPNFSRMALTWLRTVPSDKCNLTAISPLLMPFAYHLKKWGA